MNEDYLWDKSGADAEVEKLEIALQAFRYQETAAPAIPAKIIPFKKEPQRKFLRFAMAAAACLLFGITVLGIWSQFYKKAEVRPDLAKYSQNTQQTNNPKSSVDSPENKLAVPKPLSNSDRKIEVLKTTQNQTAVKLRRAFVPIKTVYKTKESQKVQPVKANVKLTKEEQYAYNQLMLALSITSSKLKIVKDKVDGIEDTNAVLER